MGESIYTLIEYKHDVERFSADLAKLAVIKDFEKNNSNLMLARLQAINALSLCMSAKTSFLNYLEIANSEDGNISIESRRHQLVKSIERSSYSAKHLVQLHHGKNITRPIKLEKARMLSFVALTSSNSYHSQFSITR